MLDFILNPRIFLIATTCLFFAGAIGYAYTRDWPMAGYNFSAAMLQIFVMMKA